MPFPIVVHQDVSDTGTESRASDTDSTGQGVWGASRFLASFILRMAIPPGCRVVELGCGVGFVAGFAAACRGGDVVATDHPSVLPRARQNLALTVVGAAVAGHLLRGRIRLAPLVWGAELPRARGEGVSAEHGMRRGDADLVIMADVVYALNGEDSGEARQNQEALLDTATALSGDTGMIVLAHKSRHPQTDRLFFDDVLGAKGLVAGELAAQPEHGIRIFGLAPAPA